MVSPLPWNTSAGVRISSAYPFTPVGRGGWDAHVAFIKRHPGWHPDILDATVNESGCLSLSFLTGKQIKHNKKHLRIRTGTVKFSKIPADSLHE
jgi:hypothetical protein